MKTLNTFKTAIKRKGHFNVSHRLQIHWSNEKNVEVFIKFINPNFHGLNYDLNIAVIRKAHMDYISSVKVTELSKLNRIVQYYTKLPQVQERLTNQIANELKTVLETEDVAVIIDDKHLCVSSHGIKDDTSATVTSYYGGNFNNPSKLSELQTI